MALHRTEAAAELQRQHPKAFLLLALIARRARYRPEPNPINGLKHSEALIGDFKEAGLGTEAEYRHAKKRLIATGQATFRGTSKGTVATLLDAGIFSIARPDNNDRNNDRSDRPTTTEQRPNDDPTTIEQRLSNKENSEYSDHQDHQDHQKREYTGGGVRRPTLEQARGAAPVVGVTPEQAEEWWHTREASDWMRATASGGTTPVGPNWQSDLKVTAPKLKKNQPKRHEPRTDNSAGEGIAPKML